MSLRLSRVVACAGAAAEPTRLRILSFLRQTELTVGQLTQLLDQSQPRVSRHLKILVEAGLVHRTPEGSFAYFRLARDGSGAQLVEALLAQLDPADPVMQGDSRKLNELRSEREAATQAFFDTNASDWDRIRALHVADERVDAAINEAINTRAPNSLLDLGTGTGRLLERFGDRVLTGLGIDASANMLAVARNNLERKGLAHCRVRQGNLLSLDAEAGKFEMTVLHQVLHLLDEPDRAIAEAARTLSAGGWLVVVDFAPHQHEFLRTEFAHRRLGFSADTVLRWMHDAGLHNARCVTLEPDQRERIALSIWIGERPAGRGTRALRVATRAAIAETALGETA
jgi:ubiquinone/menaquinone biosynthesis C-methylase UbiE